jgi:hypothetical protein
MSNSEHQPPTKFGFDPEKLLSQELVVDKIDAARRQMETAITMFFNDGDVVSQHTLVMAAHGIVYDLASKRGIGGSIKDSTLVPADARKKFIDALHLPQNFFKHADRNPGGRIRFRYNGTQFFLFDAVRLFALLARQVTYPMRVFLMWFFLCYPDLVVFRPREADFQQLRETTSDPMTFRLLARVLLLEGGGGTAEAQSSPPTASP